MTQRDRRESLALSFLRCLGRSASAFEIGAAAVRGERWATSPRTMRAKQEIGLQIAFKLLKRGLVRATRSNEFVAVY
jgi:hypothetical protein